MDTVGPRHAGSREPFRTYKASVDFFQCLVCSALGLARSCGGYSAAVVGSTAVGTDIFYPSELLCKAGTTLTLAVRQFHAETGRLDDIGRPVLVLDLPRSQPGAGH